MSAIIETVIDQFFAAIERNDFVTVAALYADDLKTWRSFDLVSQNKTEQLETLSSLNARWSSRYHVIERHIIGEQMIQRHELTLADKDGTIAHRLQAATFLTVRNGQIHVLSEYLDSRDVAPLMQR
jgi:ketosteroid isomerase-like protein